MDDIVAKPMQFKHLNKMLAEHDRRKNKGLTSSNAAGSANIAQITPISESRQISSPMP